MKAAYSKGADPFGLGQRPGVLDRIMGIDPGLSGGVALLAVPGWTVLCVRKLPTLTMFDRKVLDERALARLVQELAPSVVVVEKVQPLPTERPEKDDEPGVVAVAAKAKLKHHMGTVGAFNYGWTCAQIYTTLRLAGHDPIMVHPATWKAAAGLRGKGAEYAERKRQALALARSTWPEIEISGDGCADALLIARYGFASQLRFF